MSFHSTCYSKKNWKWKCANSGFILKVTGSLYFNTCSLTVKLFLLRKTPKKEAADSVPVEATFHEPFFIISSSLSFNMCKPGCCVSGWGLPHLSWWNNVSTQRRPNLALHTVSGCFSVYNVNVHGFHSIWKNGDKIPVNSTAGEWKWHIVTGQ